MKRNILIKINDILHFHLFIPQNKVKFRKLLYIISLMFGAWLIGYKFRDATIYIQQHQIKELSSKKIQLHNDIDSLQKNLQEYNFMLDDGDYYRYLAFKHAEILIPKEMSISDLKLMTVEAKRWKIPFKYYYRLINKESRYNPKVISGAGANGYMQIMPATFESMKKLYIGNISNMTPNEQNIIIGSFTLNYLFNRYNSWKLAIGAYNAGTDYIDKNKKLPDYPETIAYVNYIMGNK